LANSDISMHTWDPLFLEASAMLWDLCQNFLSWYRWRCGNVFRVSTSTMLWKVLVLQIART
jgi:hypothetical protein